jgi:hypothetical protein
MATSHQGVTVPPRPPVPQAGVSSRVQANTAPMAQLRTGPAFNLAGAQAFQPSPQAERAY